MLSAVLCLVLGLDKWDGQQHTTCKTTAPPGFTGGWRSQLHQGIPELRTLHPCKAGHLSYAI